MLSRSLVILICTFHAIAGQNKWIDRHVAKVHRQKLKEKFKELHYVKNEKVLKGEVGESEGFLYCKEAWFSEEVP